MIRFFLLALLSAAPLQAAEIKAAPSSAAKSTASPKKAAQEKEQTIPYLGPGGDKLSPEEYERVYKGYIQSAALLGYPFLKQSPPVCEQALAAIFRQAGLFGYPVPGDAPLKRATKTIEGRKVETYESAGVIAQVARGKNGAPESLILLNSSSPKAIRRLSGYAKNELLSLEKDPVTGLEKVRGVPVGFPHPFLENEGQGLYVRALKLNGKTDGCAPLDFQDNSWSAGFDLPESRCLELQAEAERVWQEKISPQDFAEGELKRMKAAALKSALAKGAKESEAKALIEKHFQPPFTNEITVVGSAMRNLNQCNMLALGRAGRDAAKGAGAAPAKTEPGSKGSGAGSAQ